MTASEFKAWLEGYMLDRANPDAQVIAVKAKQMTGQIIPNIIGPYYSPRYPNTSATPQWPNLGICSTNAASNITQPDLSSH